MTTHPPGHPGAPTGPGREEREQWLDANADRWPTYAEVLAGADRLLQQALAILERPVDPATYPGGPLGHVADAGFEVVGYNLEQARREIKNMVDLTKPCGMGTPQGPCELPSMHPVDPHLDYYGHKAKP